MLPIRVLLLLVAFTATAFGAIRPLDPTELAEQADVVVIAEVDKVYTTVRDLGEGSTNTLYAFALDVLGVGKGEGPEAGKRIFVTSWAPKERPMGWTGSQGLSSVPAQYAVAVFYLHRRSQGELMVQVPNGAQTLTPHTGTLVTGDVGVALKTEKGTLQLKPGPGYSLDTLVKRKGDVIQLFGLPAKNGLTVYYAREPQAQKKK